ncbi:hypothetical protein [Nocardia huaxiensis]|uniref:hypothetical protein n=1 Tax=Nocardia huaxiensis TaxID=2755382 RepID=UPI001E495C57|nr:hypothetical protein [Nocardia huaxiensis]UFS95810.1 hypothetical protein LPY97_34990 [Nocardia huaxiensis]
MDELREAADGFAVGKLHVEALTMVAAQALARGLDSPALVELACLHSSDTANAPELFLTALRELGLSDATEVDWPQREAAVLLRYARESAARLLGCDGDPSTHVGDISGLLCLLAHSIERPDPAVDELASDFEILHALWDDSGSGSEAHVEQARIAARYLLDGPPYRSIHVRAPARPDVVARRGGLWRRFSKRRS